MSKLSKMQDSYVELVKEEKTIEGVIASLPRGYISNKTISGHVYHYLQWREGSRVLSSYVPEALVNGVRQKIIVRKENEALLKIIKKDIKKLEKSLLKMGVSQEELDSLKASAE